MAQVNVSIHGRNYEVACDEGQEAHLSRLGSYVDKRVNELVAAVGEVGDARLLVMVALLLADELSDVYAELEVARSSDAGATALLSAEDALSTNIEDLAERIEVIADKCSRMAETGDMAAIREIGDRLDGKSPQYSEIAGAGGQPLTLVIETGVPARRQIEAPIIDMKPNATSPDAPQPDAQRRDQ